MFTRLLPRKMALPHMPLLTFIRSFSKDRGKGVFADPTVDGVFQTLVGDRKKLHITQSLISSLLDIKDIEVLEIIYPNESESNDHQQKPGLTIENRALLIEHRDNLPSTVDVRCRIKDGAEILVEMQGGRKDHFLPRCQYYMAKMVSMQLEGGDGEKHHIKLLPTYVLSICRGNVFQLRELGITSWKENIHYEKTVVPYLLEHKVEYPSNKMYWKFYELGVFMREKAKGLDMNIMKHQWLDFLHNCVEQESIPDDIPKVLQECYHVLELHKWSKDKKEAYDRALIERQGNKYLDVGFYEEMVSQQGCRGERKIQTRSRTESTRYDQEDAITGFND